MSLADQSQQWFPTSVQVTALQARGLRIKGKNGTNDAYAIMQVAKDKFSTSVVEKCVAPVWEEEATFDLPLFHGDAKERSTLHVYVMHRALVGPDKVLGQALINLPELHENKARDKTEWFKLLNKTGKADKDRGEVLLDIQFMKNNMTASMFDLSSQGKPRSRMGKLKDKLRGKKKEGLSDSASAIVPASQGMMDSEGEEEEAPAEVAAPAKAKKNALKSLFGTHSNLQRNTSQSMSTLSSLPERDSTLSSSVGSGLDLEAPEGKKKKFKFLTHKRTGSSDANPTQSAAGHNPPVTICINGSHVYSEESEPRSIAGSSGHGSTEDLHRTGSGAGVDPNPFTHRRQAEEQREREEKERLRRSQEERDQMEEERRRKVAEEEEEREKEERKRKEEEQKKKIEEEKERMKMEKEKEEKRRKVEEEKEKIRIEKEKEEKRRKVEEEKEKIRIEKEKEEKRRKIEEEKEKIRIEREKEEKRREIEEEKDKIRIEKEKEQRRKAEEEEKERKRLEQEERRKIAEEKMKREEEERMKLEEEERKSAEEERERARLREEEYTRVERKRKEDEERMKKEQEEEQNRLEAERLRKEEQRKTEMERRLAEEKKVKEVEEKEKRRREEEKRAREEEERMKVERKREEEDKRIHEEHRKANERLRLEEERMQKERQARDEQKLAELKRLEERERECKEGSEAEQESRPVPRTRTGNLGSRVRAGGPHVQNPFEAMTSSTNPFEDDDPSTNPFEDALSLEDSSANLFEEPPTTSQPGGLVRSARVTAVKPSTSVSGLVSQMSVAHTNPFLDDYSSGNPSCADGGTGRTPPKKGPAPLPPQNQTREPTPAAPPRAFSSTLLEETKPHSSCKEVSKCQAPLPPDRKKNTREEVAEDSMVDCAIALSDMKEKHQPVEVASVSEDERKPCPMTTQQGQDIIKIDHNGYQGKKQTTYIQVSADHNISISGQSPVSKIQANAEPFSCVGPGATKHNKGPAPARPSAAYALNRKSGSEDEQSYHSASQTMDTLHHEKQTSASLNFDCNESSANQKLLGAESFTGANSTNAKFVLHAGDVSSNVCAIEGVRSDLGNHLSEIKGEEQHLEEMAAPDAFSAPSHVEQRLHPESGVHETDRPPDMESISSERDALTGAFKKKSRAPVPPVKPKRVGDPGLLSQQSALPVTLNADDHSSGLGSFSSKTCQDDAPDPRVGAQSSAPAPPTSTGSPLPADMSPVVKTGVALSAGGRSSSVPRPVPWARVVSADGQVERGPCGAGGGGAGTAAASGIRPHAVKPLNAADRQTDRREAPELQATGSAVLSQPKKVSEALGPYAQLTHGELAAIVASQQEQLSRRDARIQELEQYIDNLLVRVMEEKPSILMAMASHKKVV